MKRFLVSFITSIFLFASSNIVLADCSDAELVKLKKEAAKVKAVYEEKEGKIDPSTYVNTDNVKEDGTYYYFDITFSNISDKFYVEYTDSIFNTKKTITASDTKDGLFTYMWIYVTEISKIKYNVYTTSKTNCPSQKVYSGALVLPKFNRLSETLMCEQAKELEECKRYVTKEVDTEENVEKILKYIETGGKAGNKASFLDKTKEFVKKHKFIFIGAGSAIVAGVVTVVILKNRKGSDGL